MGFGEDDANGGATHEEPALPEPAPAESEEAVAPDPEPGERIGEYELLEVLGRGGAGSVFKVRRVTDGALLALKVLSATKVRRARIVQRFFDEVRAASAVRHPGLVRVVDFIEQEAPRRLAYAMEYVPGEVLRARLRREGVLDLRVAIAIASAICESLQALHQVGIIHRDLKPENILIVDTPPGEPIRIKLFDFGVVKFLPVDRVGDLDLPERPGTFVGTPRYMAPEQAAGAGLDHRADLFALGVMLFEMITGRCPHEGDSLRDVVLAKLEGAPRIRVNPEQEILPHELTDLVDRCLKLQPGLRPRDAREVARALHDAEVVLLTVGPVVATPRGGAVRRLGEASLAATSPPELFAPDGDDPSSDGARDPSYEGSGAQVRLPPLSRRALGSGVGRFGRLLLLSALGLALGVVLRWFFGQPPVVIELGPPRTEGGGR